MLKTLCLDNKKIRLNFIYDDRSIKLSKSSKLFKYLEAFTTATSESLTLLTEISSYIKRSSIKKIDLNVTVCGDAKIKKLNNDFRGKNKTTDVLSFPLNEDLRIEDEFPFYLEDELFLGDIFICKSKTISQSKKFNLAFEEELVHLIVHGFLHLMGYDHEISEQEEILMESLESKILKRISKKRASK